MAEKLLCLHTVNSPATGHSIIGHLCFPAKGSVVNVASEPRAGPHPEQIWPQRQAFKKIKLSLAKYSNVNTIPFWKARQIGIRLAYSSLLQFYSVNEQETKRLRPECIDSRADQKLMSPQKLYSNKNHNQRSLDIYIFIYVYKNGYICNPT